RCLARQCREVLNSLGGGEVLEFGAGSGVMAADVLAEMETLDCLPQRYCILEVSADLKARQKETIEVKVPHLLERVVWLERLPEPGFRGVVLANEVLDAMPVHCFRIEDGEPKELFVRWQGERFASQWLAPASERVSQRLEALLQKYSLTDGYASELNLAAEDWVHSLATFMEAGVALIIDYGFPQHEFYHPERSEGTLMCHYRHRSHSEPLILVGLQDITSHVDFTAVAEAALEAGLGVRGFANQANFLLATGLTELAACSDSNGCNEDDEVDIRKQLEIAAQVKQLTLPSEMGELFKVMALSKDYDGPLQGFMLRDERSRL
ncbi:MAG: SAM-dependent methyltransferase, partial [Gammaproteobacteria bacterium]|nr:SAM-dependent methyltransferase [Gammaproteobacteria bacterium]